jgi:triosephosphate isomerase
MKQKKPFILAGNFKLNPETLTKALSLIRGLESVSQKYSNTKVLIAAPFPFVSDSVRNTQNLSVGSQDISAFTSGAHTGEVSASQIKSIGGSFTLIGHSERRALGDTNETIAKKVENSVAAKLPFILCVGEDARDADGFYLQKVKDQVESALKNVKPENKKYITIAYEPVWAIGANAKKPATKEECVEMSLFIKKVLRDMFGDKIAHSIPVLYGGSVSADSAPSFVGDGCIDGFLIGRASLDAKEFKKIAAAV